MASERDTSQLGIPESIGTVHLTPRQAEVLWLAAKGLSSKEIARHLGKSKRTIDGHLDAMRKRSGARNKSELVARAARAGAMASVPSPALKASRPAPGRNATGNQAHDNSACPGPGTAERGETPPAAPVACDETSSVSSRCRVCGRPVTTAGTGRPRAYCSRACQARAYRARRQAASP
jgi:DNA-binding CsgD family transcriptional regulator